MGVTVKVEGLRALDRELAKLPKSAGKAALRRVLKKAATPLADAMREAAPRGDGATDHLAESIAVSSRLSKRQASKHRRMFRDNRASVELFVGPGPDPAAWNQEFGNVRHGPQPFVRPAWDAHREPMLARLKDDLWAEIRKTIRRAEARATKTRG